MIKLGDTGPKVREWQEFLIKLGYAVRADGDFGKHTAECTKLFQFDQGLTGDGQVGPNTYLAAAKKGFVGGGIPKPDTAPTGKVVLVSGGHSTVKPRDPGAVGNGFTEAYLALELRDDVADLLRAKGLTVLEDGEDGESEPLAKAIALAKRAAVAVEFHWNAAASASATGIEVLCKEKHKDLAQALAGAIHAATNLSLRGDRGWKADNSGQHHRLGFCEAGGLIIEVCFISNKSDMQAYTANKDTVAANIAAVLAK